MSWMSVMARTLRPSMPSTQGLFQHGGTALLVAKCEFIGATSATIRDRFSLSHLVPKQSRQPRQGFFTSLLNTVCVQFGSHPWRVTSWRRHASGSARRFLGVLACSAPDLLVHDGF